MKESKIYAPTEGMAVYPEPSRRGGNVIAEGETVRRLQTIIKLPNLSEMQVKVKIHESRVSQIKVGQICFITIDALPHRRFRGKVIQVASLPDSSDRWFNTDLRVYSTYISMLDSLPIAFNKRGFLPRLRLLSRSLNLLSQCLSK